jgi:hypothetical protein
MGSLLSETKTASPIKQLRLTGETAILKGKIVERVKLQILGSLVLSLVDYDCY